MKSEDLEKAVNHLKDGGVVAIPTDTLYGLAADVFNPTALDRIFAIKGRPDDLALPVLVNGWDQLNKMANDLPLPAEKLVERFWPGGLTLVVQKAPDVPDRLTAGIATVAVRMPDHEAPLALIKGLGGPITGTSANISGGPDLISLAELIDQMGTRVDYVLKCGPEPKGTASTVVDITSNTPKLLREGAIPFDQVLTVWDSAQN
ncbi:MAG: L-threonylcarbamoyladenylate synthase [Dehalococcoidia bacterium]|jgi:L-threonylcarbamoyladenylate synthase|nr:L-threonylcarbamoyladenylate synthase [Dehalococcoidia bacterium]|tara:strand:+ start:384 stop:995 length:612 start_codon:yes stop_codon:yes gene_type:complete